MKKFLILFGTFGFALQARAVCPVCTIAVAGGVGLARRFGLDDAVLGIWIGGLTMSVSLWTYEWLLRKGRNFVGMKIVSIILVYAIAILPLFFIDNAWRSTNSIWGINKLFLGTVIGSTFFYISPWLNIQIKKVNNGKQFFPLQKVAVPFLILVILSWLFYYLSK